MNSTPPAPEPEAETRPASAKGESSEAGWRNPFLLLRYRNFRLFLFGLVVSQTGSWMEDNGRQWLVNDLTHDTRQLGLVATAGTLPMVVFSMLGGWMADHYSKRTILLVTQLFWTVTAFAIFGLTWAGVITPVQVMVIALINGVVNGFDLPARQAFIMEMTSRDELLAAISLNSCVINGSRIIGPALAGMVIKKFGVSICFFLNGVSFFAAIVGLIMMGAPTHLRPVRAETPLKQLLSGLHYVANNFRVLVLMLLFTVVGIFGWSYNVLLPTFATDVLHMGADGFGDLMSSAGVGALTGGLLMANFGHRFPKRGTVFASIWFFSVILTLFALNRDHHMAFVLLALNSFGMMIFFSMANTQIQLNVPEEMLGRVMGVWSIMFGLVIPIGSMEAGMLARWWGIPATIITGAAICSIAAAVTLSVVLRRREDGVKT